MKRLFLLIYEFFCKRPIILWGTLAVLIGLCVFSALRLSFVEDIGRFLPDDKENARINDAYAHIGGDNKLVINIAQCDTNDGIDRELLSEAADLLADKLETEDSTGLIKSLFYQVDEQQVGEVMDFVIQNLPYFLTEEDYKRMDTLVTPDYMKQQLANDKQLLATPVAIMRTMIQLDPLFFSSNVLQSLSAFNLNDSYHTENDHIFNKEGDEALVVVNSNYPLSETQNNGLLIEQINQAMAAVEKEMGGKVHLSCFGASQVSLTNSTQIKKDSFTSIALALVFILALLIYYYRNFRSILLIIVSITFGGLFALGLITLVKNPVSIIAVGMASIIFGIAINYPIHFLSHFKRTNDKRQIIKDIVNPLLIGNITTVGAFLSLLFISSDAMRDLGLFAALLLVGTILFVLVFLPHLMGDRYPGKDRGLAFRPIAEFRPENVKGLFWMVIAITVVLYLFSSRTSFDTNMHNINYMTKEQRAAFEKLRAEADTTVSTVYCLAEGESMEEALQHQEQIQSALLSLQRTNNSPVTKVSGTGNFLPSKSQQQQKIDRWNAFWSERRDAFSRDLDAAASANGFVPEAFQPCKDIINHQYTVQEVDYFEPILNQLAANYVVREENKVMLYNILQVKKAERQSVEDQLNKIDSHVFAFTDSSIASRLVSALSHDFDYVLYICGLIVFAFLLFSFGRLEISILAFLPLFIAWIWILGIMGITNIRFNIVNIILATFIFGMGDDYSIFVTEGLIYEYTYGRKMLSQFKNSIILSSSIMFIGIGMLIFAKHPAMRSLAQVTITGMLTVVLMAYIIPPILFKWLTTRKGQLRQQPVTLTSILRSIIAFPFFFTGVVILSIYGFFVLRLGGRTDEHKLKYHELMRRLLRATARIMPGSPFRILNPNNEQFDRPAVIISNHQSHFDLMYLLMLAPKIIVLTNKWAWTTMLYRRIVRNADFFPNTVDMESNFDKIKGMVDKGYSVLVFPEGTRSESHNILRFHQGAFFLADKLDLDILPIITNGIGEIFPKGDTIIHKSVITISIKERITKEDPQFRKGKTCLETTRLFRHYFIDEHAALKEQCDTPEFVSHIVRYNYLYKGKEVSRNCRRKLSQIQTLLNALEQVPDSARLLYKHCGNGELALVTAILRKRLAVTAYDPDEDCIALAGHCASVPANLHHTSVLPDETAFDFVIDEKRLF